ncbi:hypothetical protein SARC_08366 [Sphaeroforma arctica JP610]|uniref:CCHC-type domain-containing protein n=1 Tax=Sphaeroforma arctica JP610 TaxID=667725 RepID=A0A0L0FRN9_9EUKA|nr:hypothetical protein SARC_08366 [Sphaeroforma arctica JP610]KNC79231.1 hypothetical protein SARC_08366 [Sphaeroforma arctica JP610]|eukprot:XP_014153133.1 hypothetical protein SARC_08366 [Sphaeroforma arctica JP610]
MTRFARYGHKKVSNATPWSALKGGQQPEKNMTKAERDNMRRRERRQKGKPCYNCRGMGHASAKCPEKVEGGQVLCYRCGSNEHNIHACKKKMQQGEAEFPFAVCYICKQKGHLTRACPDNPKGLYPNGGGCKTCQSVEHLSQNCPEKNKIRSRNNIQISTIDVNAAGDDDDTHEAFMGKKSNENAFDDSEAEEEAVPAPILTKKPKKKVKVVKM